MGRKEAEWDVFSRLEKAEKLKLTVDDLSKLAVATLILVFIIQALERPAGARRLKDNLIEYLRGQGIGEGILKSIEEQLLKACSIAEKSH